MHVCTIYRIKPLHQRDPLFACSVGDFKFECSINIPLESTDRPTIRPSVRPSATSERLKFAVRGRKAKVRRRREVHRRESLLLLRRRRRRCRRRCHSVMKRPKEGSVHCRGGSIHNIWDVILFSLGGKSRLNIEPSIEECFSSVLRHFPVVAALSDQTR